MSSSAGQRSCTARQASPQRASVTARRASEWARMYAISSAVDAGLVGTITVPVRAAASQNTRNSGQFPRWVELLLLLQPSPDEEVGGTVHEPVERSPALPRADGAVGVLEAEERPVGEARRLVCESAAERARTDDVHRRLTAAASRLSGAPMMSPLTAAIWISAKRGSSTGTSTSQ